MPEPRVVWIVDREHWPRACLRAELIERGLDAVGFVELGDALEALVRPSTARPDALVLELGGAPHDARLLDLLERARIPVVALAGALEKTDAGLGARRWARVLARPVTLGRIADEVEALLAAAPAKE